MASDLVAQADRCFVEEEFDQAVSLYTQALSMNPSSPARIYESRSNAYLKLEQYMEAVEDASKALELDPSLPKAYLRKGVASFMLEEYETAKESLEAGLKLIPDNKEMVKWLRKCQAELQEDAESVKTSVPTSAPTTVPTPAPAAAAPAPAPAAAAPAPAPGPNPAAPSTSTTTGSGAPLAPAAQAPVTAKYRHQHYQMQNKVTVDVYAKGLQKDQVSVQFQEQRLTVTIQDTSGQEEYKLDTELYGKIVPEQCKFEVLRTKIEVVMVKAENRNWATLEKSDLVAAPNYSNVDTKPVAGQYPSSYTKAPKDWSKLETEVKELEAKGELNDGDPLNDFFRKIFKDGDEDQRRAMIKSFVESNGTVLSTNWNEVGSKKVECSPPDGMQVNKYEM